MVEENLVINKIGAWSSGRWGKWGCDLGGKKGAWSVCGWASGRVLLVAHPSQKGPVQGTPKGLEARPSIKACHYDWALPTDSRQTHRPRIEKEEWAGESDRGVCVCVFLGIGYCEKTWHWSVFVFVAFKCLSLLTIIISHDSLMCLSYPALLP